MEERIPLKCHDFCGKIIMEILSIQMQMNSLSDQSVQNLKIFSIKKSMNEAWNFVIFFLSLSFPLGLLRFAAQHFKNAHSRRAFFAFPYFLLRLFNTARFRMIEKQMFYTLCFKSPIFVPKLDFLKICKIKPTLICRK